MDLRKSTGCRARWMPAPRGISIGDGVDEGGEELGVQVHGNLEVLGVGDPPELRLYGQDFGCKYDFDERGLTTVHPALQGEAEPYATVTAAKDVFVERILSAGHITARSKGGTSPTETSGAKALNAT